MVIWFTGMSGSGKSTLSKKLIKFLEKNNKTLLHLDGDEIRSKVEYKNDFSFQSIKQNSLEIIKECKKNIDLYDNFSLKFPISDNYIGKQRKCNTKHSHNLRLCRFSH